MTLEEYRQVIDWQIAGRLDVRNRDSDPWRPWEETYAPSYHRPFSMFRERPPTPQMPDEVWVPPLPYPYVIPSPACSREECTKRYPTVEPVCYVRADTMTAVLQDKFQFRHEGGSVWCDCSEYVFRVKPGTAAGGTYGAGGGGAVS